MVKLKQLVFFAKKFLFIGVTVCLLGSCKTAKETVVANPEKPDVLLFTRGTAIFETVEESEVVYTLENIDTTTTIGLYQYDDLLEVKENMLLFAADQFDALLNQYPNSEFYHKSLYNLILIHRMMADERGERYYLDLMLKSNANDREASGKTGLMASPYANFKNEASNRLVDIFIGKGNFEKALEYKQLNEKYSYEHFCGNAYAAADLRSVTQYAKIYYGLGETKKAERLLLSNLFNNTLSDNSEVVRLALELLKKEYDMAFLKTSFHTAMNNGYTKRTTDGRHDDYYIKYLNIEIHVPFWNEKAVSDDESIKAELKNMLEKSTFYALLQEQ
ncbi:hypothetical protein [Maribacter sp. 2-571]|uniref:hypothetical protein n=1 Tax=Maribacter sp. 2-571 TaxID=3417569 RepID=UPI003D32AB4D